MVAGWLVQQSDGSLIIVLGEQNIQNQLDGVARNNKSCVRESFSHSKNAAMNFRRSGAYGTAVSFLKQLPSFFSSFLRHIFSLFSRQFMFVMQPNDAKEKNSIIIESVDSISKDERGFPLTQYITNGRISRGGYTFTHFKHHHRVLRLISYSMNV